MSLSEPELLSRIQRHAHTTLDLVDGFVDLAQAHGGSLDWNAVDLADLAQEACDAFWEQAAQRHITHRRNAQPASRGSRVIERC